MGHRREYDRKLIGCNLRRLREAKNLSVDEVRKYLCLGSVQAVYKYEKGSSYPPADTMLALMELYEAEVKDIVGGFGKDWELSLDIMEIFSMVSMESVKEWQVRRLMKYYRACLNCYRN